MVDNILKVYIYKYMNKYYLYKINLEGIDNTLIKKNPHCIQYFVNQNNITDISNCLNFLIKNNILKLSDEKIKYKKFYESKQIEDCSQHLKKSYIYPVQKLSWEKEYTNEINKMKKYLSIFNNKPVYFKIDRLIPLKTQTNFPAPITTVHWGQLKMLLTTIIFLIRKNKEKYNEIIVIYAGAAKGTNIILLSKMFPNINWVLVDPKEFDNQLYNINKITILKEFFTNELAANLKKQYEDKTIFFISDIRLDTDDDNIIKDQENNYNWSRILDAKYSWLKFRCPYNKTYYDYYEGKIYIQPYGRNFTSESRILLKQNPKKKTFVVQNYIGKFYYFNLIERARIHKSYLKDHHVLDNCWDCCAFQNIVKKYIDKFPNFNYFKNKNLNESIQDIFNHLEKGSSNKIKINNKLLLSRIHL